MFSLNKVKEKTERKGIEALLTSVVIAKNFKKLSSLSQSFHTNISKRILRTVFDTFTLDASRYYGQKG